ncbi:MULTISPECIES: helix-turn-helix domain-containing protein [unclassified Anoxybacillus]|uniref:helix-turn-helix domain-containing protein n=1 Tax=unclassified Anoxybacillus TaxID=2639704 RepID=UPI001C6414DB|nr:MULTISPECIES: helix-turn-helix transcriptional regulator [unclassified Anoxybacillus]MCG5024645.1 helix-turn-helix domain-containing protein [Anoxybacillus flavithermus]MCG6198047.1 helix-turn-helix domain-containing protein [Anoxybacillus sp. LAT_38]MBW7651341.1 helix-turn-helix domain-containing protein [Anoxybacillus sp. ST4]MCG3085910.1 helix-turn-helix domain-containing protein [Anoxybacillus sp. LAT27]MCG6172705.1 helix-turn-helix domain-containing protein [Anoxybacillus sp. LAT_11]
MSFGDRLQELRNKMNLRQEDVAKKIGVGRTTYAMYEQGKREPDYETLLKIADLFGVSTDYLLTGQEKTDSEKHLFFFDMDGLTEQEIEEIKKHIEFIKWKAKQERGI